MKHRRIACGLLLVCGLAAAPAVRGEEASVLGHARFLTASGGRFEGENVVARDATLEFTPTGEQARYLHLFPEFQKLGDGSRYTVHVDSVRFMERQVGNRIVRYAIPSILLSAATSALGYVILDSEDSDFDRSTYVIYAAVSTAIAGGVAAYVGANSRVYAPVRRGYQWLPEFREPHAARNRSLHLGLSIPF